MRLPLSIALVAALFITSLCHSSADQPAIEQCDSANTTPQQLNDLLARLGQLHRHEQHDRNTTMRSNAPGK